METRTFEVGTTPVTPNRVLKLCMVVNLTNIQLVLSWGLRDKI
jgi:hypothetical protein